MKSEPGFAPGMVGLVAHGPDVETFVLGKMAWMSSAGPKYGRAWKIARMRPMTLPDKRTRARTLG